MLECPSSMTKPKEFAQGLGTKGTSSEPKDSEVQPILKTMPFLERMGGQEAGFHSSRQRAQVTKRERERDKQ